MAADRRGTSELPVDLADLYRRIGDIPGTDLPGLIEELSPDSETAEQTLRDIIAQTREIAAILPSDADSE